MIGQRSPDGVVAAVALAGCGGDDTGHSVG
jgi:hypothetical protein